MRFQSVTPEIDSNSLNADSIATQVIQDNQELAKQYASGDMAVLSTLQQMALALAAGRVSEHEVKDTLMRRLGASI